MKTEKLLTILLAIVLVSCTPPGTAVEPTGTTISGNSTAISLPGATRSPADTLTPDATVATTNMPGLFEGTTTWLMTYLPPTGTCTTTVPGARTVTITMYPGGDTLTLSTTGQDPLKFTKDVTGLYLWQVTDSRMSFRFVTFLHAEGEVVSKAGNCIATWPILLDRNQEGAKPEISCFNAIPDTVAAGGSSLLVWCVTGASEVSISPKPGLVMGNSVSVTTDATTDYVLTAVNQAGTVTKTLTITVTGDQPCGNIGALQAWEGTLGFSYSRSASNADEALSLQRGGNVSFHIEQSSSGPGGVSWIGFATGNVNINDRHDFYNPPPPQVGTLIGSGVPITLTVGIEESSRVALNVRYSDCSYNFTFDPNVEAMETDPNTPPFQLETSVGSLRSTNRPLAPGILDGDLFFSAHTQVWPDDGSDVYFVRWPMPGGLFPTENSLGSAHVNWHFEHAP